MSVGRPLASASTAPKRVRDAVKSATDLLPMQGILENFIHHNPLHHFEHRQFNDALELTRALESVASPGERVNQLVSIDPRRRSNEALVDLCAVFLDRGAAKWTPSFRHRGFLWFFASLECLGIAPWRSHARDTARRILNAAPPAAQLDSLALAEQIVRENLDFFGVDESEWTDVTRAMMLELRGWAGMFHRMETHPAEQPADTCVRLIEFCAVQSVLVRSSAEALARQNGWSETNESFAAWLSAAPKTRTADESEHSGQHTSAIASLDQSSSRRETLEAEFQNALLTAIGTKPVAARGSGERAMLQLYTCIDDREGSFRRHIEEFNPTAIETFGVAGFFGIPLRFEPSDGGDISVLAPEGATPVAVLHEVGDGADHARYRERRRLLARGSAVWEAASFSPLGSLALSLLAPLSLTRLWMIGEAPQLYHRAIDFARAKFTPKPKTDFALPESRDQAAGLLARMFNDVGHRQFAPIVLMVGHGSHSVNNPFAAAYNCGACGGREGGPNARLVARLANDHEVRALLQRTHNIVIPEDTVFVGGQHDTTAETVEFFDTDRLPPSHRALFDEVRQVVDTALGKNAMERTTRFVLANNVHTEQDALKHVNTRSADAAEVRPELNHATNAAVVIGRRELTKGRFLDRRVFLPTYDPAGDDDAGTNLEHVLAPALIVCSGINLEYLFSTIETEHHGAGSKVPLNIVGNIGVLQGVSGDLRPGLPTQMTEMHVPVRALFVIDAPIARVEAVLSRRRELEQLVHNAWVRLAVRDPTTNQFHVFSDGQYVPVGTDRNRLSTYVPLTHHRLHGMRVARNEQLIFWTASAAMMMSCIAPVLLHAGEMMNSRGALIALAGTMLSLPVLSFARRYLHGEFMFGRFSLLSVGLTLGFNLVATAPTLLQALAGWSLFGFASTFLIGAYNDRPTVRNNATFAFAAYELSDFAFLCGIAFAGFHASFGGTEHHNLACAGLLLAALLKSSQFPLVGLFARSMEGPTPASALGYAGLSAHVGVVLLTSTMPIWFIWDWARVAVASVGLLTAAYASLIGRIRADRKGALANATSATLGLIFVTLALGHADLALLMSLGHAAFRIVQVLRAPNAIADSRSIRNALGYAPWPRVVPDALYRVAWALKRIKSDIHLMHTLDMIASTVERRKPLRLSKWQQWGITSVVVVLAGLPFTPLAHAKEELLIHLLNTAPAVAMLVECLLLAASVILIRFLFVNVLSARRFHKHTTAAVPANKGKDNFGSLSKK